MSECDEDFNRAGRAVFEAEVSDMEIKTGDQIRLDALEAEVGRLRGLVSELYRSKRGIRR